MISLQKSINKSILKKHIRNNDMCGRKLHQQDKWMRDLNEYHEPKSRRCAHFTPVFPSVLLFMGI